MHSVSLRLQTRIPLTGLPGYPYLPRASRDGAQTGGQWNVLEHGHGRSQQVSLARGVHAACAQCFMLLAPSTFLVSTVLTVLCGLCVLIPQVDQDLFYALFHHRRRQVWPEGEGLFALSRQAVSDCRLKTRPHRKHLLHKYEPPLFCNV